MLNYKQGHLHISVRKANFMRLLTLIISLKHIHQFTFVQSVIYWFVPNLKRIEMIQSNCLVTIEKRRFPCLLIGSHVL